MDPDKISSPKGRGTRINPPNRFDTVHRECDYESLEHDDDFLTGLQHPKTEYLPDRSQSIVSQNDSPDIPFRYSVNIYRGCAHGCSYCYARPSHEYLGLSAGLDFETKVFVKHDAPNLLRKFLSRPAWKPQPIVFSGVTDCYQPAEREFQLTRKCLDVALQARQPVGIITKNALIVRDLDLLREMARLKIVQVSLSITTLDASLARSMEPRTSTPSARLNAIRTLAEADIPVRVMVAPIIPGLTESEIPAILAAAAESGAQAAGYTLLRLPLSVKTIFLDWLERHQPLSRDRIESRIRTTRDGRLNTTSFGQRMRGTGPLAAQIEQLFRTFARKHRLQGDLPPYDCSRFRRPTSDSRQLRLFPTDGEWET